MAGTRRKALGDVVVVSEGALPDEQVLGWLTMFTSPDDPRSSAKFVRSWATHGLNPDDLPEARQPVHVFQSACASVRQRRSTGGPLGTRVEIAADEVQNNGSCDYQITLKVWDRANRVIEHEKGLRLEFDKKTSQVRAVALDGWDDSLRKVESQVRKHMEANAATIPGQKIRNAVRTQLLRIGAQNVRRKAGGVYFVPKSWSPDPNKTESTRPILDGLKGVLMDLYGEERADFDTFPLANSEGERDMVRKHFVINVNKQAEELALKAIERVRQGKGRGVRADLLGNLYSDQRKLVGAVQQFDALVGVERSSLNDNLDALRQALEDLQDLADS